MADRPAQVVGTTKHYAEAIKSGDERQCRGPAVLVANDDDSYYWQAFRDWGELAGFVKELIEAGLVAFGPKSVPPDEIGHSCGESTGGDGCT